ncbi:selenide, water dikinase SelD [Aliiruegeria lutimaris]|uniref:Selenophosphate synthase n=1 Tax=Aliiruegeria lutimaris TaxID=571298 RepID=A0A1G9D2P6_9RHOB|nr:selenide, water dikinase SelD [Aliiruegeria lutimaris]SDK58198.1 selenophosphate synthase [Aliiruegeria lutimaris]
MHLPLPLTRDLVLVGGGHSHALLLRMWGMDPLPGARLTLINPGPVAFYSGMLPGHIAGHYDRSELQIDLVRLARFAGARFVDTTATGIDTENRQVKLSNGTRLRYDALAVDIGITTDIPQIPGFAEHGVPAKPLDGFALAWNTWCDRLRAGAVAPQICIIGAGIAGVELALAMRHRSGALGQPARIEIVDSARALDGISGDSRSALFERLRQDDIILHEQAPVAKVTATGVELVSGAQIEASFVLGCAGARPHDWIAETGLQHAAGYLSVDRHLRSLSAPEIFASGDCADLSFAPRPKAGVYAVRAAPILFQNLRATLAGGSLRRFRPQKDYLKLVSLGDKAALADRSGVTLSGPWLWRWKDWIDRRFMHKMQDLPRMPAPPLPPRRAKGLDELHGDQPLCGGCGAKVAGSELQQALAKLPAPMRPEVASLPGDDAAILSTGDGFQVLTTDHLRAFTEDPALFARIAAVHALGDIWAMGAAPQVALANVTLPPMRGALQQQTLGEILGAATEVFRAEGADLVGGHTSTGAECSIGFTLTGLRPTPPVTLAGGRPGDALILTKPLGTGTILAGEMQGRAHGADVLDALASMARPQGTAARILAGAHAMTDVTGFGLAGHLLAICDASELGAEIRLEDIGFYRGAVALAADGIRSTLAPANRDVSGRMLLPEDPRAELLFDPQTAGGLLAAVGQGEAQGILRALLDAGFDARQIGSLVEGPAFLTVL